MLNSEKNNEFKFMSISYTTFLKGIAILIVMLGHMGNFWGISYFTPLGGIGVACFLILSGYGLAESQKKSELNHYWTKKLIDVYIPYVIIRGIIIIIQILTGTKHTLVDTLLGFSLLKNIHVYDWYLSYLFIWYFIFYIVNLLKLDDKKKFSLFITAGIIMFLAFKRNLLAEQSLSFLFGVYLSYYKKSSNNMFLKGFISIILGVVALALKQIPAIRGLDIVVLWNFIQLVNKFFIACGIILCLHSVIKIINLKPIYYVGVISFELYLIHGYTIEFLKYANWQGYVAFFISSFLLAWIANRIISLCTAFLKRRMINNEKSISQTISNS